jgi:hypothetical protein
MCDPVFLFVANFHHLATKKKGLTNLTMGILGIFLKIHHILKKKKN